jgi:hypothetical protein
MTTTLSEQKTNTMAGESPKEDSCPVLTVEQEEQMLERLTRKRPDRKKVLFRLGLYCVEMVVVVLIAAQIPDLIVATLVAVLLAFLLTKLIEYALKNFSKEKGPKSDEAGRDTRQELVKKVAANWDMMPEFFKDQLVSFLYKGESVKLFLAIRKKRTYQKLVIALLQARKAYRDKNYDTSRSLLEEISCKANETEHADILTEVRLLREALPVLK